MVEGQKGHSFEREPLVKHLDKCAGKTLGELDVSGVFKRAEGKPKVTGIAGDVIEQSVLGLERNPKKEPDIVVDDVRYEVKTTGVRKPKHGEFIWEAKEPMTITAVSPNSITKEDYSTSAFWHKVAHLLLFYYHYDSVSTVQAAEYAKFKLLDYQFHEYEQFTKDEREMLEGDWVCIRNFINYLQEEYGNKCEDEYPRLSHDLRERLLLLDTAPKWPNPPRFRFKRSFVSSIVHRHFAGKKLEELPGKIVTFRGLDDRCFDIVKKYKGKTVGELCDVFGLKVSKELKSIAEPIIIKMFGGTEKSMRKVEFFNKVGVWGKSFVLTKTGGRTEDAKFFTIDFNEFKTDVNFEESQFRDFFSSSRILIAIFEEPSQEAPLVDNRFVGFHTIIFDDDFIDKEVKPVWNRVRELVRNKELRDVPVLDSSGHQVVNKNGTLRSAPNFPKSSDGVVFIRGTGVDSSDKRECVNGIRMYYQQVWLKGDFIARKIQEESIAIGCGLLKG